MKKLFVNHWKELAIVCVYITVGSLAYGVWFNHLWHKWYINLITVIVISQLEWLLAFSIFEELIRKSLKKKIKLKKVAV
jgi:hypothetical protein